MPICTSTRSRRSRSLTCAPRRAAPDPCTAPATGRLTPLCRRCCEPHHPCTLRAAHPGLKPLLLLAGQVPGRFARRLLLPQGLDSRRRDQVEVPFHGRRALNFPSLISLLVSPVRDSAWPLLPGSIRRFLSTLPLWLRTGLVQRRPRLPLQGQRPARQQQDVDAQALRPLGPRRRILRPNVSRD
jgi:hypothetical protein